MTKQRLFGLVKPLIALVVAWLVMSLGLTQVLAASPSAAELLTGNKAVKQCVTAQGAFYLAEDRVRADFTFADTVVHLIIDGSQSYTWLDGFTIGFSGLADSVATDNLFVGETEFGCDEWAVDESLFARPAGINFLAL